jgi:hypothetical protein
MLELARKASLGGAVRRSATALTWETLEVSRRVASRKPFFVSCNFKTALQSVRQQTVDGAHAALEKALRSSYVPNAPIGVQSPVSGDAPFELGAPRLELPVWMK